MGHGAKQAAYLDWKVSLLANIPHARTANAKGAVFADFTPLAELSGAARGGVLRRREEAPHLGLPQEPDAARAGGLVHGRWLLHPPLEGCPGADRGGTGRIEICVEAMSPGSRDRLVHYLRDTHGLDVKLKYRGERKVSVLQFTTAASEKFQKLVAPYVHPSMEYKLLPRFRGQVRSGAGIHEPTMLRRSRRVSWTFKAEAGLPIMSRYDIEVEGSHNYLADGIIVTTVRRRPSGGKALKFYASIRLDVRRIETLKDGTDAVGNRTRVKVVKNKMRAAVQKRRIRYPVRYRDQPRGQPYRPRRGAGNRAQVRRLVHLRRRPARPGQGERP